MSCLSASLLYRRPSIPQGGFDWYAHKSQRRKTVSISLLPVSDDDEEEIDEVDGDDDDDDQSHNKTSSYEQSCAFYSSEKAIDHQQREDARSSSKEDVLDPQRIQLKSCLRSSRCPEEVRCSCTSSSRHNLNNNNIKRNNNHDKATRENTNSDNDRRSDQRRNLRKKKDPYETVIINVGGQIFETYRTTIRKLRTPIFHTKDNLQLYYRKSRGDYFFDRDPTAFGSILNFLRTGELHIPTNMCGPALQNELDFWGIEEADIARCCWTQYNTWKTQCRSLEKLEYDRKFSTTQPVRHVSNELDTSCWSRHRSRVWTFLQDPESSRKAKAYAWVSIIFVFISIFSFCAETHPTFKVKAKDVTQFARFYDFLSLESIDWSKLMPQKNQTSQPHTNITQTSKPHTNITQTSQPHTNITHSSEPTNIPTLDFGLSNKTNFSSRKIAKRSAGIHDYILNCNARSAFLNIEEKKNNTDLGEKDLPHPALLLLDLICLTFFTMEYLTRFMCSPSKTFFVRALQNIVDFLAFAPDYVELVFLISDHHQTEGVAIMEMLFILRILRLCRIFRLIRHVPGLWILLYTLRASFNELMLMCVFLLIGMVVFATLVHFVEPDGIFNNIPVGFWWSVVTMTTVGYGDMYPQSPAGFFIGSCCAVAGLLMIAFTVPIIVSNFVLYYTHVQYGTCNGETGELERRRE
ncbi:unnamed protein product [Candidula unifasciata]|uniref:BTB domain-containing protein n=1 Tax=Candidula unifasciata TaxID=100452 RepID=A0A8S3ZEG4_9EUPU|nr:unnamed protein product [Candidula unifasciata]